MVTLCQIVFNADFSAPCRSSDERIAMKTLFVYYSLEGNCRALAQLMAAETGGTV